MAPENNQYYLGLDAGTSGIRAVVTGPGGKLVSSASRRYQSEEERRSPRAWLSQCLAVLEDLSSEIDLDRVSGLAVDGQSGTVLLCDASGHPVSQPKFYHEPPSEDACDRLAGAFPGGEQDVPQTLGRVVDLWTLARPDQFQVTHQADWLAGQICGRFDFSDENNSLKLGYDPSQRSWVFNADRLPFSAKALPSVLAPAQSVGFVSASMASLTGLPRSCQVFAGTTDSIAGFLAASGPVKLRPGTAVTSLGTTMVLKAISSRSVNVVSHGVYSHRFFDDWLAGGASNSGGGALLKHFSAQEMALHSRQIDPSVPSNLDYYPLSSDGERFPVADPDFTGRTTPRPKCDVTFLAGLLEAIARIEKRGYDLLHTHGVPYPEQITTVGGGSRNDIWRRIRERVLGVPIFAAEQSEAAYGSALLAEIGARGAR